MIFYKDLPGQVSDYVIPRDYMSMVTEFRTAHDWRFVDTDYFLNDYGRNWFLEKGLVFKKQSSLFKGEPHIISSFHSDSKINDLGINFILQGEGEMQWVEPVGATEIEYPDQGAYIQTWINIQEIKVLGTWTGKCAMVNVKVPHRVTTLNSDVPRVCFSLRPDLTKCSMNFDKLYNLF